MTERTTIITKCEEHPENPVTCDCQFSCGACGSLCDFSEGVVTKREIGSSVFYEFTCNACLEAKDMEAEFSRELCGSCGQFFNEVHECENDPRHKIKIGDYIEVTVEGTKALGIVASMGSRGFIFQYSNGYNLEICSRKFSEITRNFTAENN